MPVFLNKEFWGPRRYFMVRLLAGVWSDDVGLSLPDKEFWGSRRRFMPRLVLGVWSGGVGLRLPDKEFWGPRRYFMPRLVPECGRAGWVSGFLIRNSGARAATSCSGCCLE